jgi:hypothetical protein
MDWRLLWSRKKRKGKKKGISIIKTQVVAVWLVPGVILVPGEDFHFIIYFLAVLGFELKDSHLLSRHSTL